jgi:hypothetical protein
MANIVTTPEEIARARLMAIEKKAQRKMRLMQKRATKKKRRRGPPRGSVHTFSGGLPTLGKRR